MKSLLLFLPAILSAAAFATDYPPAVRALMQQGVQVASQFDAGGGIKGYAARVRGEPLALYLMPDGKHLIVGTMLDANGASITHAQLQKHLPEPDFGEAWVQLEKATWVRQGAVSAKRIVYVFTDPECPFCNKLWTAMQPSAGKELQVRHILVGVLKPTSFAKAAAILSSPDPAEGLRRHETAYAQGGIEAMREIPAALRQKIEENNRTMAQMGIAGTPAVFYKDRRGKVRRVVGMPDAEVLKTEILQQPAR